MRSQRCTRRYASACHAVTATALTLAVGAAICLSITPSFYGSELLIRLFSHSCHQISDRCLTLGCDPMPICARCFGICTGAATIAWHLAMFGSARFRWKQVGTSAVFIGITGCEWVFEVIGIVQDASYLRFFTGVLAGIGIYTLISLFQLFGLRHRSWERR